MNRAYAFAAGVVVAGVAASLFAGNPNPPAGPIGPTMVSLADIANGISALQQGDSEWRSQVITFSTTEPVAAERVVFTGKGVVKAIQAVSHGGGCTWKIWDSGSTQTSGPAAGVLYTFSGGGSATPVQNVRLELGTTVSGGLTVTGELFGNPGIGSITVIYRTLP